MIQFIKSILRETLTFLKIDLTQNIKYDRLTKAVIAKVLTPDSVCIDVGCHKGEILDLLLKYAPKGGHYAFEPIPNLYASLVKKHSHKCHIFPFALSDKEGTVTFQHVKNQPAYSGILKRKYAVKNPDIEELTVPVKTLDTVIPENCKIDFIKIDVEGGEFGVLKGAEKLLKREKPILVFECGMGASEYYGTTPEAIFDYLDQLGYGISLMDSWLNKKSALSKGEFCKVFKNNSEYYFIGYKRHPTPTHS